MDQNNIIQTTPVKKSKLWIWFLVSSILIILLIGSFFIFRQTESSQYEEVSTQNSQSSSSNNLQLPASNVVGLDSAKKVADNYLPRYFPDKKYVFVDYLEAFDLKGELRAYILIFRKPDFAAESLEKITDAIVSSEPETNKYFTDYTAIIMASAVDTDGPLLRAYRGLPEIFVEKINIEKEIEDKYKGRTLGRIIFLGPTEIYYEIANSGEENNKPLSENSLLINPRNYETLDFSMFGQLLQEQKINQLEVDRINSVKEKWKDYL